MIDVLLQASGRTHENAHSFVQGHRHAVDISWDVACKQFTEREVPKWIARTAAAYPNCDLLSPGSLGALVSLSYNRGCGLAHEDRRIEMCNIHDLMAAKH